MNVSRAMAAMAVLVGAAVMCAGCGGGGTTTLAPQTTTTVPRNTTPAPPPPPTVACSTIGSGTKEHLMVFGIADCLANPANDQTDCTQYGDGCTPFCPNWAWRVDIDRTDSYSEFQIDFSNYGDYTGDFSKECSTERATGYVTEFHNYVVGVDCANARQATMTIECKGSLFHEYCNIAYDVSWVCPSDTINATQPASLPHVVNSVASLDNIGVNDGVRSPEANVI